LLTHRQLYATFHQLQKVVNHPKCIFYSYERLRVAHERKVQAAEGSEFVDLSFATAKGVAAEDGLDAELFTSTIKGSEAELRNLTGESLVQSSGKLQLLDRLLDRVLAENSRYTSSQLYITHSFSYILSFIYHFLFTTTVVTHILTHLFLFF
jgi:hypothetical protein